MCGILGIVGHKDGSVLLKKGLALLSNRGADGVGTWIDGILTHTKSAQDIKTPEGDVALGHTLHAIVDHVPQPVQSKGVLTANCEIYNWKTIAPDVKNDAQALASLLDEGIDQLDKVDGVFAFAYLRDDVLTVARDLLGVKPVWYVSTTEFFAFCSEKKVLIQLGFDHVQELNPRQILQVNVKTIEVKRTARKFFSIDDEISTTIKEIEDVVERRLLSVISKRIPNQKFGLLFSGGVDSTIIAKVLYEQGHRVPCYVVNVEGVTSKDVVAARAVSEQLGLDLREVILTKDEIESLLPTVASLIEDSNVVKIGVALTFFAACRQASEDGCRVVFSGLGSEEIFAGYQRHLNAADINKECLYGLLKMYERDLYRDDVITMDNGIELRLPFLDHELIRYALRIPSRFKIADNTSKKVLRDVALHLGVPKEVAYRPKSAAQYGSGVDKMIGKLAKSSKSSKSEYLRQFYTPTNSRLGVLFSGGKDSTYAAHIMKLQNYELTCLLTMRSDNNESYMFHTPAIDVTAVQAKAMDIPILFGTTKGEKEAELADLRALFARAKEEFGIDGIVTGALFSTYQRDRIERLCDELGLKIFAPLWHKPQAQEMRELLDKGYQVILTSVAADGLDSSWLGRVLDYSDLKRLGALNDRIGLNVAGEGGEFESLVVDCPLFSQKVVIESSVEIENEYTAKLVVRDATLAPKNETKQ